MPKARHERTRWISHFESLIGEVLGGVPLDADEPTKAEYIEGFRDEFGNRRASDRAFLCHLLGVDLQPERDASSMAIDERLWWCVARDKPLPAGLIAPTDGLLPNPDELAIEYRTMIELCAMQAFWSIALRHSDESLRTRALEAAGWHASELQPDNAINRPWGIAVYLELAIRTDDDELAMVTDMYAQTLLHNACINFGRPDLLSALILKDAIGQLRAGDQ